VEIREIAETGIERHGADLLPGKTWVGEQAMGTREALCQHVFGERRAFRLE
jgi:hypothetical protein